MFVKKIKVELMEIQYVKILLSVHHVVQQMVMGQVLDNVVMWIPLGNIVHGILKLMKAPGLVN